MAVSLLSQIRTSIMRKKLFSRNIYHSEFKSRSFFEINQKFRPATMLNLLTFCYKHKNNKDVESHEYAQSIKMEN